MNILTDNNVFLESANAINQICQPLRKLNITYFTYLKNFFDGSQVYLSNSAQWIEDYYRLKLYKSSLFEANPDSYHTGYFIWPIEDNSPVFLHGREYFDSANGITIIKKNANNCEFYFFSGPLCATWLREFYWNNIDLLEKFILFFKESGSFIVKKADKNPIILPKKVKGKNFQAHLKYPEDLRTNFLKDINMQDKTLPLVKAPLTNRESEIAYQLLNGKTANDIGNTLVISKRTVERHIENMKRKWSCKNKAELIKLILAQKKLSSFV